MRSLPVFLLMLVAATGYAQTLPYHQLNIMPHPELTNLAKGVGVCARSRGLRFSMPPLKTFV